METTEISNFVRIWISVIASLCYCYAMGRAVSKGITRLFCLLPVICLFLYLPLHLSAVHLQGSTAFFIAWLANFKLLLFAFDKTPFSQIISLPQFIAVVCLPIKIQENPVRQKPNYKKSPLINYAVKVLLLAMLAHVYDYKHYIHPIIASFLYCMYVYIQLEILLALVAGMARYLLGVELEAPFDKPYLSTSLQDFWGRRWNIMVSSALRPTVYEPIRDLSAHFLSRNWAPIPAVIATFAVSAVMHDLILFYLGREQLTWDMSCFFLLNGVCLTLEIALKKKVAGRWRFSPLISGVLTIGFVMLTGFWLFLPSLHRSKVIERASMERAGFVAFIQNAIRFIQMHAVHASFKE